MENSAVEWLEEKYKQQGTIFNLQFEQAKEMEKQQKIKFAFDFYYDFSNKLGVPFNLISENRLNAEQYYNETFKSEKMKKEFVPYELAVKLKSLGFDEECFGAYHNEDYLDLKSEEFDYSYAVKAPTFSQAFRWFREKYAFYVVIKPFNAEFSCIIWISKAQNHIGIFKTYEEAEIACLDRLLEIVESKTK